LDSITNQLIRAAKTLGEEVDRLRFAPPVAYVYNPLHYAWGGHEEYLQRFGNSRKEVIFLGMNPGPFGMVQTGVPFGEIQAVRDWMRIEAAIDKPIREHPKRLVLGFACKRSEVSGRRLWGLFAKRFPRAQDFFNDHLVVNYCPLAFLEEGGANRTPNKLTAGEKRKLFSACDEHLREVVRILQPKCLVAIGGFAEVCARRIILGSEPRIVTILHPSPASPAANRDWSGLATAKLEEAGVWDALVPSP